MQIIVTGMGGIAQYVHCARCNKVRGAYAHLIKTKIPDRSDIVLQIDNCGETGPHIDFSFDTCQFPYGSGIHTKL